MAHFIIDGFDFGIDPAASVYEADGSKLHIKLVGSEAVIDKINEEESHPWNWLIYPPFFHFWGLPYEPTSPDDFQRYISEDDLGKHHISLYAMEHCRVFPCSLHRKAHVLKIVGQVHDIDSHPLVFDIECDIPLMT